MLKYEKIIYIVVNPIPVIKSTKIFFSCSVQEFLRIKIVHNEIWSQKICPFDAELHQSIEIVHYYCPFLPIPNK